MSKSFDWVDHRFLATVLETVRFKPEFRKWINMLDHNPQAVVQVNGERSEAFALEQSVRQGCSLSPLLYVLALEPLLYTLRDRTANPALRGVLFAGRIRAKISAYTDDITVFVSSLVVIDLIGSEQNYAEKGGLIQDNLILYRLSVLPQPPAGANTISPQITLEWSKAYGP